MLRDDIGRIARRALEAVGIGSHLIAFYPREIHRSQPYVIFAQPGKWDSQATRPTSGEVIP